MSSIVLFENDCFTGKEFPASGPVPDLKPLGFGDKTSSIIVLSGAWVVYQDKDYKGNSWIVKADGGVSNHGVYPNPASWGGKNDSISSLKPV
jgi:hypothetical protein